MIINTLKKLRSLEVIINTTTTTIIIIIIIIIIINIRDWTLRSVPSPGLQLLSPTFLRSSN
jgi:hypothetical protein